MGLDMYLSGKLYLSEYEPERKQLADAITNLLAMDDDMPVNSIEKPMGYWRKANQIHNWFVNNVQRGEDNCGTYYVSREDLKQLYNTVTEVLLNKEKAPELLPSVSGCFFGSTEYTDGYFEELVDTINILNKALSDKYKDWTFNYSSSW
jgi:hypothetical protein